MMNRRYAFRSLAGAGLALPGLMSEMMAGTPTDDPMAPKPPHFPAKAKRVIFLYMTGGVSHVDSFDPKPKLTADHGKEFRKKQFLVKSKFAFKRYGQSGLEVSELFPHVAECADLLTVIRSMKNDDGDHFGATLGIHAGQNNFSRPSMGSWVSYGLGTFNKNLPSFVVIAPHLPYGGGQIWGSDFLPAAHQGMRVVPGGDSGVAAPRTGSAGRVQSPPPARPEIGRQPCRARAVA
jgi:hypothetical protein